MADIIEIAHKKRKTDEVKADPDASSASKSTTPKPSGGYLFPCNNVGRDSYERELQSRHSNLLKSIAREMKLQKENEELKQHIADLTTSNSKLTTKVAKCKQEALAREAELEDMQKKLNIDEKQVRKAKFVENCLRQALQVVEMD